MSKVKAVIKPVNEPIDWDAHHKLKNDLLENRSFLIRKTAHDRALGIVSNLEIVENEFRPAQKVTQLHQLFNLGYFTQGQLDAALDLFEAMDYLEARPPASSMEPRCGESDYDIEDDPRRDVMRARRKRFKSFIDPRMKGEIECFDWVLQLGYDEHAIRLDVVTALKAKLLAVILQRVVDG